MSEHIQFSCIVGPPCATGGAEQITSKVEVPVLQLRKVLKAVTGEGPALSSPVPYSTRSTSRLSRGISLPKLNVVCNVKDSVSSFLSSRLTPGVEGRKASALRLQISETRLSNGSDPRPERSSAVRPVSARPAGNAMSRSRSLPQVSAQPPGMPEELSNSKARADFVARGSSGRTNSAIFRSSCLASLDCPDGTDGHRAVLQQLLMRLYHCQLSETDSSSVLECCPEVEWLAKCVAACPLPVGWRHIQVEKSKVAFINERTHEMFDEPPTLDAFVCLAWCAIQVRMEPGKASNLAGFIHKVARNAAHDAMCLERCWTGPHYDSSSGLPYFYCPSADLSSWQSPFAELQFVSHVADSLLQSPAFHITADLRSTANIMTKRHFGRLILEGGFDSDQRLADTDSHGHESRRSRSHSSRCSKQNRSACAPLNFQDVPQLKSLELPSSSRSTSVSTGSSASRNRSREPGCGQDSGSSTPRCLELSAPQDLVVPSSKLVCSRSSSKDSCDHATRDEGFDGMVPSDFSTQSPTNAYPGNPVHSLVLTDGEVVETRLREVEEIRALKFPTNGKLQNTKGFKPFAMSPGFSSKLEQDPLEKAPRSVRTSLTFAPLPRTLDRIAPSAVAFSHLEGDPVLLMKVACGQKPLMRRIRSGVLLPPLAR